MKQALLSTTFWDTIWATINVTCVGAPAVSFARVAAWRGAATQ